MPTRCNQIILPACLLDTAMGSSLAWWILTALLGDALCQPNIVLFITDDQDLTIGGMGPLKKTIKHIAEEGASMMNSFTTTPICCPSRASILTGLYQKNHRVFNNSLEGGCSDKFWQDHLEKETFAVYLKKANYTTFYGGKYLNQYGRREVGGPSHVPPGWDNWIGLVGNSKYYNYTLSINGTSTKYTDEYLTSVLEEQAIRFLRNRPATPFLMVLAPPAPHQPFTPEPKYRGAFKGTKVPREPHFNKANNSEKHWLVRMKPSPLPNDTITRLDEFYASRWETLLSVDDLVDGVVEGLRSAGQLNNTYIIFTSDNGFHLGQFSMPWDKRQPYDFDVRVPFLIRGPGIPRKSVSTDPALLLDIYSTILHIAGITARTTDGKSLLPFAEDGSRTFFYEYKGEGSNLPDPSCPWTDLNLSHCSQDASCKCQDVRNNTYSCVRTINTRFTDFVYCRFHDDEDWVESYDLSHDPYQLVNLDYGMDPHSKKYFSDLLQSWNTKE